MPEGHTVHRLAQAFEGSFVGCSVAASSPQGRFREGAAALDGQRMVGAEAWGKQMFLAFEAGLFLRVHLGMYGMWRFFGPGLAGIGRRGRGEGGEGEDEDGRPAPRAVVRLRLKTPAHVADLSGPSICAVVDAAGRETVIAGIGPDPLRPGSKPARAWAVIHESRSPIGLLLMRQEVVGGIGNIYRAELLFRAGIDPHRPGRDVTKPEWDALWRDARKLLRDGVRDGAIITTRPADRPEGVPVVGRRMRRDARSYVAFRNGEPCRRCGTPVLKEDMGGRSLYWCPACQR